MCGIEPGKFLSLSEIEQQFAIEVAVKLEKERFGRYAKLLGG